MTVRLKGAWKTFLAELVTVSGIQSSHLTKAANRLVDAMDAEPETEPLLQPERSVQERYNELLYAVARIFPGESRHQTALRYIREAEDRSISGPDGQKENIDEYPPNA